METTSIWLTLLVFVAHGGSAPTQGLVRVVSVAQSPLVDGSGNARMYPTPFVVCFVYSYCRRFNSYRDYGFRPKNTNTDFLHFAVRFSYFSTNWGLMRLVGVS